MFERYSETARRVIFFARYEASHYGSTQIGTEHVLLGLTREDPVMLRRFLATGSDYESIRTELEKHITRGERISTAVEIPLTEECKKVLNFANEERDRMADKYCGTGHLLLGLLRADGSLAAQILRERGARLDVIRERLAEEPSVAERGAQGHIPPAPRPAGPTVAKFLAGFALHNWEEVSPFFVESAQFIDGTGKRWAGRDEIEKQFETLFAPYAKKNVTFVVEDGESGPNQSFVASALWRNVSVGGRRQGQRIG